MLFTILGFVLIIALAVIVFFLFYLRSLKETPKNKREWEVELKFQIYGIQGFLADILFRFRNRVGELLTNAFDNDVK